MSVIILKAGHTTTDPRLDRVPQWDDKNGDYNEREILNMFGVPLAGPRSFSWRAPTLLNQGQDGACVGFSWSGELAAWPVPVGLIDDKFAFGLYRAAQDRDEWPGHDYEGSSVLAGAKACKDEGYMDEYRWALTPEDLFLAVGYHGPVVVGIKWKNSMFDPRPSGLLEVSGSDAGGHAILVRGCSVNLKIAGEKKSGLGRAYRFRQSWGPWGLHNTGDAWILENDLFSLFDDPNKPEAVIPVIRNRAPHPEIHA